MVAVYGLTYDPAGQTLYAATHGRSIWKIGVGVGGATVTGTHVPGALDLRDGELAAT